MPTANGEASLPNDGTTSESSFSSFSEMSTISDSESPLDYAASSEMTNTIRNEEPQPPPAKNSKYFMQDENVTFVVEATLFRVHRYFFVRDSEHFRAILGGRYENDGGDECSNCATSARADEPISLNDVKAADFERFLDVLYPSDFDEHSLTTLDEWTSVLHLSSLWGFKTIRALAVRAILPLASPVDRVYLGRKYDIPEWLFGAYTAICARAEALTADEGYLLGMHDVVRISALRQALRACDHSIPAEAIEPGVTATFQVDAGGLVDTNEAVKPPVSTEADEVEGTSDAAAPADTPSTGDRDPSREPDIPRGPSGAVSADSDLSLPPVSAPDGDERASEDVQAAALQRIDEMMNDTTAIGEEHTIARVLVVTDSLDSSSLQRFAHALVDKMDVPNAASFHIRLCRRVLEHLQFEDYRREDTGDTATLLPNRATFFSDSLVDYTLGNERENTGAVNVPRTARKRALKNILSFCTNEMFEGLVTIHLPPVFALLTSANTENLLNVLLMVIGRYNYKINTRVQPRLNSIITGAVQTMNIHVSGSGDSLLRNWESVLREAKKEGKKEDTPRGPSRVGGLHTRNVARLSQWGRADPVT